MVLLSLMNDGDGEEEITRRTEINEDNPVPEGKTKILPLRIPQIPEETKPEEFEHCIYCWRLTDIPLSLPIHERAHYIEGAGQLCDKCYTLVECGDYFIDGVNEKSPFPNPNYHRTNYHNI